MFIVSPHKFFVNWDAALATHSFVENKNTCQNELNSKNAMETVLSESEP